MPGARRHGRGDGAPARPAADADAVITNGAGNFSVWAHRFYEFRRYRTQLAPTSGAMGYGVPAAVAAKLLHPERTVVVRRRRRRLPDDRRRSSRPPCSTTPPIARPRGQQRHVRHDPDAPGAPLPRPRVSGTDLRQPRLRRARARVRRPRRARRANRGRGRRRSIGRSPPACRPSCTCSSTPSRSRRGRR